MTKQDPKEKKDQPLDHGGQAGKGRQHIPKLQESKDLMKSPSEFVPSIIFSKGGGVSTATSMGLRDHQEDYLLTEEVRMKGVANGHGDLMAVFDGHNGPDAAERASKAIYGAFAVALATHKGDVLAAFRFAISGLTWLTADKKAGTTLSLVYVPKDHGVAYVAVMGDSPVIILDKECRVIVSPEHNVRSNPTELESARRKGALFDGNYILNPINNEGLQLSRALGGKHISPILSREPDTYSVKLGERSIIVLGTDGLFDPGHGDTAAQIGRVILLAMNGADAKELVQDALNRRTEDNATAIIWRPR